jgi:hypothetical protein
MSQAAPDSNLASANVTCVYHPPDPLIDSTDKGNEVTVNIPRNLRPENPVSVASPSARSPRPSSHWTISPGSVLARARTKLPILVLAIYADRCGRRHGHWAPKSKFTRIPKTKGCDDCLDREARYHQASKKTKATLMLEAVQLSEPSLPADDSLGLRHFQQSEPPLPADDSLGLRLIENSPRKL